MEGGGLEEDVDLREALRQAAANASSCGDVTDAVGPLQRHLYASVVLPRVRDALSEGGSEDEEELLTAATILDARPAVAQAIDTARREVGVAAARALAEAEAEAEAGGESEDEDWGYDSGAVQAFGARQGGGGVAGGGKGGFSIFSLLDLPDVVLADLGAVAGKLAQGADPETQLAGLTELEGSILTELAYSEHWPPICQGLGGLLASPDEPIWGKALKILRELFGCLTPTQCADVYLAVAVDLARSFQSQACSLSPAFDPPRDAPSLWTKTGLLHEMQGRMGELFPLLTDAAAAKVAAWTLVLLRGLRHQRQHHREAPALSPLLCAAHLLAAMDATGGWFREWCLRLRPAQWRHLLRRTGLPGDLARRCLDGSVAPGDASPLPLARRLQAASLWMLAHAWQAGAVHATDNDDDEEEEESALWDGAALLDPSWLPAAASDLIVGPPLASCPSVLGVRLREGVGGRKLAAGASSPSGPPKEATTTLVVTCLELFTSRLLLLRRGGGAAGSSSSSSSDDDDKLGRSMARAASHGLVHLVRAVMSGGGGGGDGTTTTTNNTTTTTTTTSGTVMKALERLAEASDSASASDSLILLTALRVACIVLELPSPIGPDEHHPLAPVLAAIHREAVAVATAEDGGGRAQRRQQQQITALLCASLRTLVGRRPELLPRDLAAWPTHALVQSLPIPPIPEGRRQQQQQQQQQQLACRCLASFALSFRGLQYLGRHPPALEACAGWLVAQAVARLRELREDDDEQEDEEEEDDGAALPLPSLLIPLQQLASLPTGAAALLLTGGAAGGAGTGQLQSQQQSRLLLMQVLLDFLFREAPRTYGVRLAEHLAAAGPGTRPPALHAHLDALLLLLRPLAATVASWTTGAGAAAMAAALQQMLAPLVARACCDEEVGHAAGLFREELLELSLRVLAAAASTVDGAAWLNQAFPQLDEGLKRRLRLVGENGSEEEEELVVDGPALAASYLRSLLHAPDACPQLPPPPPLLLVQRRDEEELDDVALHEALAVLAGHALAAAASVGAGWGGMPVYFFEEQRQREREQQQGGEAAMGGGAAGAGDAFLRLLLEEGRGAGAAKAECLPLGWGHIEQQLAALSPQQSEEVVEPSPVDVAKAGIVATHAVRWGMFPSTDRPAFQAELLDLRRRAPQRGSSSSSSSSSGIWHLGGLLLLALGRADRVLAALLPPLPPEAPEEDTELQLEALADAAATALRDELPAASGALERGGLAVRAVVLGWLRASFWGTLSVAELGIATALAVLHGRGYQACVALALLRRLHLEGRLTAAVAATEGADATRLHDLLLRAGHGFEFSPEVVAWMEGLRKRHGF